LLRLIKNLQGKIITINNTIGLDTSVLGEVINPKVFGIISNLRGDEKTKTETLEELEAEQFGGGEVFWQPLKDFGLENLQEFAASLPNGIQSGLKKNFRGIFFYYKYGDDYDLWYLYDAVENNFITSKSEILNFISCKKSEPRVVLKDVDPYVINEKVKQEISDLFYRSFTQTEIRTAAGKKEKFITDMMEEIEYIREEFIEEDDTIKDKVDEILSKLNEISFTKSRLKDLRRIWKSYKGSKSWRKLLTDLSSFLKDKLVQTLEKHEEFDEDKLKLICVDFIS